MSQEEKKKNIGAIWAKTSSSGTEYLSISIEINGEKLNFSAFRNQYKEEGDTKPEWNIAPPREQQAAAKPVTRQASASKQATPEMPSKAKSAFPAPPSKTLTAKAPPKKSWENDLGDEDIPF